jgi:hypothetical protein
MVHGILQFTPRIAFRYVLHRCESRDIRCRESYFVFHWPRRPTRALSGSPVPRLYRVPWRHPAPYSGQRPTRPRGAREEAGRAEEAASTSPAALCHVFSGRVFRGNDNDPSAGSPTETLLRLLLPLNDKVQWTSRDVTGGEPPASPRSEHFTGPFNR